MVNFHRTRSILESESLNVKILYCIWLYGYISCVLFFHSPLHINLYIKFISINTIHSLYWSLVFCDNFKDHLCQVFKQLKITLRAFLLEEKALDHPLEIIEKPQKWK